jgi:hypothetical protein
MKNNLLDPHQNIAFDLDGTLVNGPNSQYFCDYILANPDKNYHLVTFRDQTWAERIYAELASTGLKKINFSTLNSIPQDIYMSYASKGNIGGVDLGMKFVYWKGWISKHLGATVLVDDMEDLVLPGCKKYGVAFINAWSKEFPVTKQTLKFYGQ